MNGKRINTVSKASGIVRRIDDLGRVVIPKEMRKSLGLENGHAVEMMIQKGGVFIKSYEDIEFKSLCEYSEDELLEEVRRRGLSSKAK